MYIPDLTIYLQVNIPISDDNFYSWFYEECCTSWNFKRMSYGSAIRNEYNIIEFSTTTGYEPGVDSYPYHIHVTWMKEPMETEEHYRIQINFMRELIRKLEARGCQIEVEGEFEGILDDI